MPARYYVDSWKIYFIDDNEERKTLFHEIDGQVLVPRTKTRLTGRLLSRVTGRTYQFILKKLQYNDTLSFFLSIKVTDGKDDKLEDTKKIIISKINGEYEVYPCFIMINIEFWYLSDIQ